MKQPETLQPFPRHRRRHLKSDTFSTILRFLSFFPEQDGDNNTLGRRTEVPVDTNEITGLQIVDASCAEVVKVAQSVIDDRMETNKVNLGKTINKEPVPEKSRDNNELGKKTEVRIDVDGITKSVNENRMETNAVDLEIKMKKTLGLEKGRASNELEQAPEVYGTANIESEKRSTYGGALCPTILGVVESVLDDKMETDEFSSVKRINKELSQETGFEISNSLEETNSENCVLSLTTINESQNYLVESLLKDSETIKTADIGDTVKFPLLDSNEVVRSSVIESSELQQVDLENSLSNISLVNSSLSVTVEKEVEEGEISGDFVMDNELIDFLYDDKQTSGLIVNTEHITNEKGTGEVQNKHDQVFETTIDGVGKGVKSNFNERNVSENYLTTVREIVSYANLVDSATTYQGGLSTDKDAGVDKKRKRGPITQEKRAKKKKKERIKRAEKDRQLGVKRLKIQPVSKPKTIQYCRHYLNGRCHEGDKCKFSHDTTPLTKSKPCSFFATGICQKDYCPYDHELSKYPCNNILTKGVCVRGVECKFSHEVKATEGTLSGVKASNSVAKSASLSRVTNPEKKTSLNKSLNQKVESEPDSGVVSLSSKIAQQKNAESRLRAATSENQGISKFLFGKSPLGSESNVKANLPVVNTTYSKASNFNGMPKVTGSSEPPKGLSLISFGKNPTYDATCSINKAENLKSTNRTVENIKGLVPNLSETPKKTRLPPRGINFLSFGRIPVNNSSNMMINTTSNADNGASSSAREGEMGQNLGKGALLFNGTNTAQKALQSTLACAAMYASSIKI